MSDFLLLGDFSNSVLGILHTDMPSPESVHSGLVTIFSHYHQMESQSQHIKVEQSQSDRSKRAFYPVR